MYEYYYQSYLLYYTHYLDVVKCFLYIFKKNNFLLDKTLYSGIIVIRPLWPGSIYNTRIQLNAISNGRGTISNSRLYQSIYGYNQKIVGSCMYIGERVPYYPLPTPLKTLALPTDFIAQDYQAKVLPNIRLVIILLLSRNNLDVRGILNIG